MNLLIKNVLNNLLYIQIEYSHQFDILESFNEYVALYKLFCSFKVIILNLKICEQLFFASQKAHATYVIVHAIIEGIQWLALGEKIIVHVSYVHLQFHSKNFQILYNSDGLRLFDIENRHIFSCFCPQRRLRVWAVKSFEISSLLFTNSLLLFINYSLLFTDHLILLQHSNAL